MKKIIVTFIAALILAAALIALSGCGDTVVLNVYNWGEYISTGKEGTYNTNREFEKWYLEKYGKKIRVNYETFDSNESLRAKLETGSVNYDVIVPSDYMIEYFIKNDMLAELDFSNIPEYKNIDEKVNNALDLVGLTPFADYYPKQLSASMLQRVVIARAFATQPDLLLMDEPYGQLDINLRFKLEDEVIRLCKQTKTTVLFITHNIEEAVYLGDRILVLTNKPTSIKEIVPNDAPHPRDIAAPDFIEMRNRITNLIKWW